LLGEARLLLVFTPEASGSNDPLAALERALDAVDAVEVRPKPAGEARARTSAREAFDRWRRPPTDGLPSSFWWRFFCRLHWLCVAAVTGPVATACPASILRRHRDATLFLDEASAEGLG